MSQMPANPEEAQAQFLEMRNMVATLIQRVQELETQAQTPLTPSLPNPTAPIASPPQDDQINLLLGVIQNLQLGTRQATKSERHPDPEPFNGNRADLDRFISQLFNKLDINGDRYPTDKEKVGYAFGRLSGLAATTMEGYWTQGACSIHNLRDFVDHLERLYGNPHRKEQAANEWMLLRQDNREFSEFLAQFERLAAIAGITEENQRRRQLGLSISNKLRYRMASAENIPTDYVSFRERCIQIESRFREADALASISKVLSTPKNTTPRRNTLTHPARDTAPARLLYPPNPATGANATPIAPRTTTYGGNAMDLSRQRGPLTSEEKQRRKDLNLCLYCGNPGHIARDCPNRALRLAELELDDPEAKPQAGKV